MTFHQFYATKGSDSRTTKSIRLFYFVRVQQSKRLFYSMRAQNHKLEHRTSQQHTQHI